MQCPSIRPSHSSSFYQQKATTPPLNDATLILKQQQQLEDDPAGHADAAQQQLLRGASFSSISTLSSHFGTLSDFPMLDNAGGEADKVCQCVSAQQISAVEPASAYCPVSSSSSFHSGQVLPAG
jgi:hypothetical protein